MGLRAVVEAALAGDLCHQPLERVGKDRAATVPVLIEALADEDAAVRWQAARALDGIGPEGAVGRRHPLLPRTPSLGPVFRVSTADLPEDADSLPLHRLVRQPADALFQRLWRFVGPRTHNKGWSP
jgi:hypothetical protein